MKNRNKRGGRVSPCIVPLSTLIGLLQPTPCALRLVWLSVYICLIMSIMCLLTPMSYMTCSSLSWSTVLKAEAKSTYTVYMCCPALAASSSTLMRFLVCLMVFLPFLKPYCISDSMPYFSAVVVSARVTCAVHNL